MNAINIQGLARRLALPVAGLVLCAGGYLAIARPAEADAAVHEGYNAIWNAKPGDALKPMVEALRLDPGSPERWTDLAEAMYEGGRADDARYCTRQALERAPGLPHIETRAAGMYFRLGDAATAIRITSRIFAQTREYDGIVFQLWQRLGGPAEDVYRLGVGTNTRAGRDYFVWLAKAGDVEATDAAWKVLTAKGMAGVSESRAFDAALVAAREFDRAAIIESGLLPEGIDDGGFEGDWAEQMPGWRAQAAPGVSVSRDSGIRNSGTASLRLEFDGSSGEELSPISQTRVLAAGVYRLQAMERTDLKGPGYLTGPAATVGVGLRLVDVESGKIMAETAKLNVTRDWTPVETVFTVGPHARPVRIEVMKPSNPSSALNMTGTAWIDDVKLSPVRPGDRTQGISGAHGGSAALAGQGKPEAAA